MSNSKKTAENTLLAAENTLSVSTKNDHEVWSTIARARVHIHGTEVPKGADTLVLRSMDGTDRSSCSYWKKRPVQEATAGEEEGILTLDFTISMNDGTKEWELKDLSYLLAWRPTDSAENEVLLFQNRAAETVWQTEALEEPVARLMVTRFYVAKRLTLPDRDPPVFDDSWTPEGAREDETNVPDAPNPYAGVDPDSVMNVEYRDDPVPVRTAADLVTAQSDGDPSEMDDSTPPAGPRWVTVLRRWDDAEDIPSYAEKGLTGSKQVELIAVCKVTEEGTYKYATFGAEDRASVEGDPQSDVLLPPVGGGALYARLSMVPPTKTALRAQVRALNESHDDDVSGSSFLAVPLGDALAQGPQATVDDPSAAPGDANGGVVYLPNPLSAAQRRFLRARSATDRLIQWQQKTKGTMELSGLVADTCFSATHGRSYLQADLKKGTGGLPWGEREFASHPAFSGDGGPQGAFAQPPETGDLFGVNILGPEEGGLLGHVMHGYTCKRAFLRKRRDRAVEATRKVLHSPLYRDLLYEAAAQPETDAGQTLGTQLIRIEASMAGVGDGRHLLRRGLTESLGAGPSLQDAMTPLEKAKDLAVDELIIEEPTFKALFVIAQGSPKALEQLVLGAAPSLLSAGVHLDLQLDTSVPDGLALTGGFLVANAEGTGSVATHVETAAPGEAAFRVERAGASARFEQKEVEGLKHRGTAVRYRWQAAAATELTIDPDRAARAVGLTPEGLSTTGTGLDALNVLIAGAALQAHYAEGRLEPKDGVSAAKFFADSADLWAAAKGSKEALPAIGKMLVAAGPALDAVEVAWTVSKALAHEREQGLQEIDDPNYAGAVGHVALTVGSGILLGSFGVAAGIGGAALVGLGGALHWYQRWENVAEDRAADPLTDWLPTGSQWGTDYAGDPSARNALVKLVQPGIDPDPPPAEPVKRETKKFVEKAFTFPTAVGVPPKPDAPDPEARSGPPDRLFFSIIPEYVPKTRGTFMVDATVEGTTRGMMKESVDLACAVHYVQVDRGFRYCVVPPNAPLELPGETSLSEIAEAQKWAWAQEGASPVPGGEPQRKRHFPVHVGGTWPVEELSKTEQQVAEKHLAMDVSRDRMSAGRFVAEDLFGLEGTDEGLKREVEEAKRRLRQVGPASVLPAPEGLGSILESGRFEVSGYVYFNPLHPFQIAPSIPSGPPAETGRMLAGAEIDYMHSL